MMVMRGKAQRADNYDYGRTDDGEDGEYGAMQGATNYYDDNAERMMWCSAGEGNK